MIEDTKACPFCAEEIKAAAVFCRHCRKDLAEPTKTAFSTPFTTVVAKGTSGQLELHEHKVVIKRKGFLAFMNHGFSGDKEIMLSSVSSIQFKGAGKLTSGFIQFSFRGGLETKKGLFNAASDENSVVFNNDTEKDFLLIKDRIETYLVQKGVSQP